ncbi:hypothetical protein BN7_4250 [Wickerhamomyces ciferrii]|uniref:Uncharacterized protein n=1 Tax=Wickerhamomyces ciferrii (strain ATCC 14091 / BCRC 22168 / CBS 111 / JCM 3599 / NBRC 0793 / NRRL Y-1031 F-60-10) TaxID=1206466 RepID=K0KRL5_WICCF|nr:uncharacterized protein BN7_4250 [Wickerhamomyces ciferrii]CCH44682.1 hypothetical protein BN7_4250 [Wickerhamomyces ciferrii]
MSDKEVELTEEQLKEQKLEAARKKNKGKKKKSKKTKKGDDNDDSKDVSVEPTEESVGSTENVAKEESTVDEAKEETNVDELEKETTDKDDVKEEKEEKEEQEEKEEKEEKEESNTEIEEKLAADIEGIQLSNKEGSEITSNEKENKDDSASNVDVPSSGEQKQELEESKSKQQTAADDLFPEEGPSFMDTIKQAQADDTLEKTQLENNTLKADLEKVKKENKELKLLKLDHLEQIETLEARVADLEAKLAKAKVDSSRSVPTNHLTTGYVYDQDETLSLSPTPSSQQPFSTTFSQFKPHHNNESQLSLGEIKAKLSKWKGWNIDMTNWRSVGSGPIVEL